MNIHLNLWFSKQKWKHERRKKVQKAQMKWQNDDGKKYRIPKFIVCKRHQKNNNYDETHVWSVECVCVCVWCGREMKIRITFVWNVQRLRSLSMCRLNLKRLILWSVESLSSFLPILHRRPLPFCIFFFFALLLFFSLSASLLLSHPHSNLPMASCQYLSFFAYWVPLLTKFSVYFPFS